MEVPASEAQSLIQLGFSLSSAPKDMVKVLEAILEYKAKMEQVASSYTDDILVNKSVYL